MSCSLLAKQSCPLRMDPTAGLLQGTWGSLPGPVALRILGEMVGRWWVLEESQ